MTKYDSDRVHDLFTGSSRDVTPAPLRHAIRVLFAPISCDLEVNKLCASVLSEAEQQRADRFAAGEDRAEFEQRRAFRRYCGAVALESSHRLSEIAFEETPNGRPFIPEAPDLWFSFSSCRFGMLGAWSWTHAVGVDVEDQSTELEAVVLARQYFSAAEAGVVAGVGDAERLRTFYRFWSLKEAALKSIGEGLPFGLDAFHFELDPNPSVVHAPPEHGGTERFDAHLVDGTDCCAALVIRRLG